MATCSRKHILLNIVRSKVWQTRLDTNAEWGKLLLKNHDHFWKPLREVHKSRNLLTQTVKLKQKLWIYYFCAEKQKFRPTPVPHWRATRTTVWERSQNKATTRVRLDVCWCTSEARKYKKRHHNVGYNDFLLNCNVGCKNLNAMRFSQPRLQESFTSKWWLWSKVDAWNFTRKKLVTSQFNESRLFICRISWTQLLRKKSQINACFMDNGLKTRGLKIFQCWDLVVVCTWVIVCPCLSKFLAATLIQGTTNPCLHTFGMRQLYMPVHSQKRLRAWKQLHQKSSRSFVLMSYCTPSHSE